MSAGSSEAPGTRPRRPALRSLALPVDELGITHGSKLERWVEWLRQRADHKLSERGIATRGAVVELAHFHPEYAHYEPSAWSYFRAAVRQRDVGPDDVFVDFGCGRGRVLYQAAHLPFARVIGVEISERLSREARANIAGVRDRLAARRIEIVHADATQFEIPDDMTFAYFFHPFTGDAFRRVIDRMLESLDRHPRRLRLVYVCPSMEEYLHETGRFRLHRRVKGGWRDTEVTRRILIYDALPADVV